MCDKMAISAYILKIVKKDPFLRLQMKAHRYTKYTPDFAFYVIKVFVSQNV